VCRIVLIDGHQIFRQALEALFATEEGFDVVGMAGRADEALQLLASQRPDVVLTDLELADCPGVQLIEQIHTRFPRIAILVLTACRARDRIAGARRAGARGYLVKDRSLSEVLVALRVVAAGRRYRGEVAVSVERALAAAAGRSESAGAAYLTERQRTVLRSIALGYRAREIAEMLGVSVRAVHKQRERLFHTLQLSNTAALTRFALREGLAE
jgi:DNA-binding NarL/FixJ family response regulator